MQQQALLRRITERIRDSLELKTVLRTAVEEIYQLLNLDRCLFFWYDKTEDGLAIVCDQTKGSSLYTSHAIYFSDQQSCRAALNAAMAPIAAGKLVVYSGLDPRPWWFQRLSQSWRSSNTAPAQPNLAILDAAANLLVPVHGQQDRIGYIACLSDQPRSWSASEVDVVQSIAQQLEIAIRQAQLYEQTQQLAQREQLVNHITRQTRSSLDVEIVLTQAIAQLLEALNLDRCLIHLVEDLEELYPAPRVSQTSDCNDTFRRKHLFEACRPPFAPSIEDFDTDGPMTRWVIQSRQIVAIPDITQDERIGTHNLEYQQAQIKSSLVVPVQSNDALRAILYLNQCSHVRYWSDDDQKLAEAVADHLAITIQQSQFYARTRQQALESAAQAQHLAETLHELKRTQAQLIQSEKISSLGQLVAGLAHEINNPISFIYGNVPYVERYVEDLIRLVEAYRSRCADPDPELRALIEAADLEFIIQDLPQILTSMQSGAHRIREIVQSLRSFSRLDESSRKVTDIHQGIESAIAVLKHQLQPHIQIIRQYGDLPLIDGYPRLLNQVFMNLLINSIEALNRSACDPKQLTILTEALPQDASSIPWVRITISDNGPGIPPDVQPRIFDPFFTTKDIGQGAGLGLAVSYQTVVEQHGGRLTCDSSPGQGTTFVIELPVESLSSRSRESSDRRGASLTLTGSQSSPTATLFSLKTSA